MEYLPHVRQLYHDMAGLSGLSPYQRVYCRERHNAGVPYEGVRAEAAEVWFQKQKYMQKWVKTTGHCTWRRKSWRRKPASDPQAPASDPKREALLLTAARQRIYFRVTQGLLPPDDELFPLKEGEILPRLFSKPWT